MVTAVIMVGAAETGSVLVDWVQGARQAAARDLMAQLQQQPLVERIILVSPDALQLAAANVIPVVSPRGPIHVGEYLAQVAATYGVKRLL